MQRPTRALVGYVVSRERVIGEWQGQTWDDVPDGARLYANTTRPLWPMLKAGACKAKLWKKGITSWAWGKTRISNLRGTLDGLSPGDAFGCLLAYTRFIQDHGGSIASPGGMIWSLWRATLDKPVVEYGNYPMPTSDLLLGSRQSIIHTGHHVDVSLWDISSAYSYTLGQVGIPRRWVYAGSTIPETGFVLATVYVPPMLWGPLPIRTPAGASRWRLTFPIDVQIEGIWHTDEIKAAQSVGCEILTSESWAGDSFIYPFEEWYKLVTEAKRVLPPECAPLLKHAVNTLWGSFAVQGQGKWLYYRDGKQIIEPDKRKVSPQSTATACAVASHIRARIYNEAMIPHGPFVIAAHTDGVFIPSAFHVEPNSGGPGKWRVKLHADELTILSPQVYALVEGETVRYTVSGMPMPASEKVFLRLKARELERRRRGGMLANWDVPTISEHALDRELGEMVSSTGRSIERG